MEKKIQLGISIRDLDLLTIGLVNDMYAESRKDDYKYREVQRRRTSIDFKEQIVKVSKNVLLLY